MPDPKQHLPVGMTIIDAVELLEEFRQQIIDEKYEDLVDEGEIETKVNVETMEALDVALYYINTLNELPKDEDL